MITSTVDSSKRYTRSYHVGGLAQDHVPCCAFVSPKRRRILFVFQPVSLGFLKDVDVQLLLFESFGGIGRGVREILWKAANVLQNKLTRAQYLDEVTWTTKNWLGLQKQRVSRSFFTRQSQSRL